MLTIKNDNNLKVVTIRILTFLSGCILALLKVVFSPLKKIVAVNVRKLLLGMSLWCNLVERNCKITVFWPHDLESLPIMPG